MSLFSVGKNEIKMLKRNKFKLLAVSAVIIIPLLYSFFYLKAYWDPYGNLKNYHIAIVDKDIGASVNGEFHNYGSDIIDKLKEKKNIGFQFVSESEAKEGLKANKYFAEIEIPQDFSGKIASAKDGNATPAKILYLSDNKKNYIGTKISDSIENEILKEISQSISGNYGKVAFDNIYEMRDGLKDAANGIEKIIDGTNQLADGSEKLTNGLSNINSEVPTLQNGVSSLASGSNDLNKGLGQLNSKIPEISSGTNELTYGVNSLGQGLKTLEAGTAQLSNKSSDLVSGSTALAESYDSNLVTGYVSLTKGLKIGADQINSGAKQVQQGVNSVLETVQLNQSTMNDAQKHLQSYLAAHPEALTDQNIQAYLGALQSINQQTSSENASKDIQSLETGISQLVDSTSDLSSQLDINAQNSSANMFF